MSGSNEMLGEWLDRALSDVPSELAVRIRTALPSNWRDADFESAPEILGGAAVAELDLLLQRGCDSRRSAPALLTVDALVTYACELLALVGTDIDARTSALLDAICSTLPNPEAAA